MAVMIATATMLPMALKCVCVNLPPWKDSSCSQGFKCEEITRGKRKELWGRVLMAASHKTISLMSQEQGSFRINQVPTICQILPVTKNCAFQNSLVFKEDLMAFSMPHT